MQINCEKSFARLAYSMQMNWENSQLKDHPVKCLVCKIAGKIVGKKNWVWTFEKNWNKLLQLV